MHIVTCRARPVKVVPRITSYMALGYSTRIFRGMGQHWSCRAEKSTLNCGAVPADENDEQKNLKYVSFRNIIRAESFQDLDFLSCSFRRDPFL